jgi:predicted RNase H-like nuclease (RuvC/YqgF family)
MFNTDVLEAIELLRKDIRTSQKETKNESREKVKELVHEIIKEIAAKENKELKEENTRRASIIDKQGHAEITLSRTIEDQQEELTLLRFQLTQKEREIEDLRIYEGKVNCILNNHVAFKDINIPNASFIYKMKVIIDYFLTEESTKEDLV